MAHLNSLLFHLFFSVFVSYPQLVVVLFVFVYIHIHVCMVCVYVHIKRYLRELHMCMKSKHLHNDDSMQWRWLKYEK